ncbi:MAG: efflux transporter outer membrane subunit [Janthinobacterium lividum]
MSDLFHRFTRFSSRGAAPRPTQSFGRRGVTGVVLVATLLAGCAVGPNYQRATVAIPAHFKEAADGWKPAAPADRDDRGAWWLAYQDPTLTALIEQANQSNQTVASYEAAYRQAQALTAQARSGYFPTVSASSSATRSGSGGGSNSTDSVSSRGVQNSYSLSGQASWEPDLWGKVQRDVASEKASQQAAAADLANARLSAQATLAQDYFQLRALDSAQTLLDNTVAAYQRSLALTQNRYQQGVAGRADVVQAQTQLQSAQAAAVDNGIARAQYEHAIAVLIGQPASTFSLAHAEVSTFLPEVPAQLPSTLLERRPDVAAAERRAAAANEQIGVAMSAFFPTLSLSASGGFDSATFAQWLTAPARVWSLGPQLALTLFDGGLRHAQVEAARAAFDEQSADYRQTVLQAFQDVEDNLVSLRVLANEIVIQQQAVVSAQQALNIVSNEYKAGTTTYLDVLSAQATAFSAQRSLIDIEGRRLVANAGLVKALGGGWDSEQLVQANASAAPTAQARVGQGS